MSSRGKPLLALVAAAVALPLLLSPAAPARQDAVTVTVTLTDSAIRLSKKTAIAGKVTFSVRNAGKAKHDFRIAGKKTPVLAPGASAKLVVTFAKVGKFAYGSTQTGDLARGLRGSFTVTSAISPTVLAGRAVFVATGCGGCHILRSAAGVGTVGPNLDLSRVPLSTIMNRVLNGRNAMPPYRDSLTPEEIRDVANFVFQARGH